MSTTVNGGIGAARAAADLEEGTILATVEVAAGPQRVFKALTGFEVIAWWIRPGIFNTSEWAGEVRVGGPWRAAGTGGGKPYALEGTFLEIDSPRRLVHTWKAVGAPGEPTRVIYRLDPVVGGTRITLHHVGFASSAVCTNTCLGWEASFEQLASFLSAETPSKSR